LFDALAVEHPSKNEIMYSIVEMLKKHYVYTAIPVSITIPESAI